MAERVAVGRRRVQAGAAITELPAALTDLQDVLPYAVAIAVLAPSGHNTQPWKFAIRGDRVELRADRSRRLAVVDPDDRELIISCGAALAYLRLAVENAGFRTEIDILPLGINDGLIAVLTASDRIGTASAHAGDVEAIVARRTNRNPYEDRPVPDALLAKMQEQAVAAGAWLEPVPAATREAVADLIADGDRAQLADPSFRRELASWVHHNHSAAADGMRAYGFGVPGLLSRLGPFVIRTFDNGDRQAAKDRALAIAAPVLVVLGTDGDTTRDWVAAGQALAHILLTATRAGVSAAFMNQPVELTALRPRLAALVRIDGAPQLVLRMGYGPPMPPQPRRTVADVLSIEPCGR